jgi:mannose-6-phosphate isomerase-like protein (cupin superfamily)
MLSQIENGKAYPSVRSIYSIAAALGVPVDYFFPDDGVESEATAAAPEGARGAMTASELRAAIANSAVEGGPAYSPPVTPATPVVNAAQRPTIQLNGGVQWARLTARAEPDAEFLEVAYEPGAASGAHMSHHQGREFGLIVEGVLIVELGFEQYRLAPGDSIVFDSTTPHRLVNPGPEAVRAIWVVLSPAA